MIFKLVKTTVVGLLLTLNSFAELSAKHSL